MKRSETRKRVLVAMSGGVDSSVTALLLKEKGYQVTGITMQLLPKYYDEEDGSKSCCGLSNIMDAQHVASLLGIPHYVLNMREQFQERVINNFSEEYKRGRTPNPCIRCNQFIKFGILLKKALALEADYVATGHYARIEHDQVIGNYCLKRAVDIKKDQSYFLYVITQNQLKHTLMPLGYFKKDSVRAIAKENGLPVSGKEESQEICFVQGKDYRSFLKEYIPDSRQPGPIIDKDGKMLGYHKGIIEYTIGQRKGLGISDGNPLYVIEIDRKNNTLVVGREVDVYHNELIASDVNWTAEPVTSSIEIQAKIRSLHKPSEATLIPAGNGTVRITFSRPQWAITPGQAVVFYKGDRVIGGGIIANEKH